MGCPVADGDRQCTVKGRRSAIRQENQASEHAHGAELAFTFQGEALGKRVKPLAEQLGVDLVLPCDVEDIASVDATFAALREKWGKLDFVIHAIGFADKNELKGRYADTSRENFSRTMDSKWIRRNVIADASH